MNKILKYQLANTAGYKFNITKIGEHVYDDLAYYHKENFPDLKITRPGVPIDLSLLNDKALLTVNGYFYDTVYLDENLYIPNATKSMNKARNNSIGILSFNSLENKITKIKLTPDMITQEYPTSLYEKAIITFNRDIGTPLLVVAGYMIFEHPEFFYRVSGSSFVLRLDRLNYIEKLYELNRYRDIFVDLEIPTSINNSSLIDAAVARSDTSIINFLTTYNSFLVEVPVTSIETRKIFLEHSSVPGNFRTEIEPNLPIYGGYGKVIEYNKRKSNDYKYNVYTTDAYYNNHLFSKLPYDNIKLFNDHREVGNTYRLSEAFFLEINCEE